MNPDPMSLESLSLESKRNRITLAALEEARNEAQASAARLRTLVDTIPTLAWSTGPGGATEFMSQRWLDFTGLAMDEALGWGWKSAVHPDDLPAVMAEWQTLMATKTAGATEGRLRRADGVFRRFLFRVEPMLDADGNLLRWYGTSTDVEDQRQAEEQLRRSERNLAEGQWLTKTGSWVLDFETGMTDWSVETCRIFGFPDPPPSPHYSEFLERVHPKDRDAVNRGLGESFETRKPRPLDYVFVLPSGEQKHIQTISQPTIDESGKLRLMGTVMDVTAQRKSAETLLAAKTLARGQLSALTRALDALSTESNPERLLEHVLRTVTDQLHAHSCSVWQRIPATDLIGFEVSLEGGRLVTKADHRNANVRLKLDDVWPWPEVSRTGKPHLLEDIRAGRSFPWRENLVALGVVSILVIPMSISGVVEGFIGIRFTSRPTLSTGEIDLAQALAHQAMLAIQVTRLSSLNRESAIIAERNRMARDIHDTLAQGFTGVIMQLEAATGAMSADEPAEAATHIQRASALARSSLEEARRSVRALRPRSLLDGNLCAAMEDLFRKMADASSLEASFHVEGAQKMLPPDWEEGLLRIAQESLTNAIRHARARNFRATLTFESERIHLQITDDGRGFDPESEHDGFGLIGMQERVDRMGGDFIVQSQPGRGAEITVILTPPTETNAESDARRAS